MRVHKQQGFNESTTDYVGSRLYENGSLKRIFVDGGYLEGGNYYFYLTDHLGSPRVVAKADGAVMQTNHYYAYGLTFAEGVGEAVQKYKFNGKELDADLGLNYHDFGARLQDPVLGGRFGTTDPMARKYYPISPYAYCAGNPVKFVDPTGKLLVDARGNLLWSNGGWTRQGKSAQNMALRGALEELQKTPTGKKQFSKLVNGPTKTQLKFGKLTSGAYGSIKSDIANGKSISAIITIDSDNNREKAKDNGVTHPQAMASTLGHEIRHIEDENVEMQETTYNKDPKATGVDLPEEQDANAVGEQIINEYKNPPPQNNNNENSNSNSLFNALLELLGIRTN